MKPLNWLLFAVLVIAGWLGLSPTDADPVAWTAPTSPGTDSGIFASNRRLSAVQRTPESLGIKGPEAISIDPQGHVTTGLMDGRIIRFAKDMGSFTVLGNTGGRPLGMAYHPNGSLIITDAKLGLIALDTQTGQFSTLATQADGLPIRFADDIAITRDGSAAYFSDATTKWPYDKSTEAVLEHAGDGRLLRYNFQTGQTTTALKGLQFANGVALAPDDSFVLINESGLYRVTRLWLTGEQSGQHETLIDNLPGLPDNITSNGKDRFWVALFAPRNPLLDALSNYPALRKVAIRAMSVLPRPVEKRAMAIGLDSSGKVIANLQDDSSGNYSPITSVREHGDTLYFGSLSHTSVARMGLADALQPAAASR
jgi:hypothetical protein